jgi:hypothetical protein
MSEAESESRGVRAGRTAVVFFEIREPELT